MRQAQQTVRYSVSNASGLNQLGLCAHFLVANCASFLLHFIGMSCSSWRSSRRILNGIVARNEHDDNRRLHYFSLSIPPAGRNHKSTNVAVTKTGVFAASDTGTITSASAP